jgi:hypothetical protein
MAAPQACASRRHHCATPAWIDGAQTEEGDMMQAPNQRKQRATGGQRPHVAAGRRLIDFRKSHYPNVRWTEYAVDAGLSAHAYRQNENGKTLISVENALLLKRRYGIKLGWIYDAE